MSSNTPEPGLRQPGRAGLSRHRRPSAHPGLQAPDQSPRNPGAGDDTGRQRQPQRGLGSVERARHGRSPEPAPLGPRCDMVGHEAVAAPAVGQQHHAVAGLGHREVAAQSALVLAAVHDRTPPVRQILDEVPETGRLGHQRVRHALDHGNRALHGLHRGRLQDTAARRLILTTLGGSCHEPREIIDGGVEASGGRGGLAPGVERLALECVPGRGSRGELVAPREGRVVHPERLEHLGLGERREVTAGDVLHEQLEHGVAGVGVAKRCPGRLDDAHRLVIQPCGKQLRRRKRPLGWARFADLPGQAGGVAEEPLDGDAVAVGRVVWQLPPRQVPVSRRIEVDRAVLHQPQHRPRGHRLRDRSRLQDGVGRDRLLGLLVGDAVPRRPGHFTVDDHRGCCSWHAVALQLRRQPLVDRPNVLSERCGLPVSDGA